MKLIFISPDLAAVSGLKNILESAGIACFINNEVSAALVGAIPTNESTPELWIGDDSREAEAFRIKKDWLSPQIQGASWVCPKCGEKLEAQFTSCWKCGTKRTD